MAPKDIAPLVVVVGETASGKTDLAIKLAQRFDGEIICADSRTVYEGMDIATAKPSREERQVVRHHILDLVKPDQTFTVTDFKRKAIEAINSINSRSKLPILAGGSGLYVDSIIYDYKFSKKADFNVRERLQKMSLVELQKEIIDSGIGLPNNFKNKRHLIRAIETKGESTKDTQLRPRTLVMGLRISRDELHARIRARIDNMVKLGLLEEVKSLGRRYGWDIEAMQTPGYKAFSEYIKGHISLEQAKEQFIRNDLKLAKKQRTWFKRNNSIQWLSHPSESVGLVTTFLNNL